MNYYGIKFQPKVLNSFLSLIVSYECAARVFVYGAFAILEQNSLVGGA